MWTTLDADLERISAGDSGFDRPDSDYITGQEIPIEGGMVPI